MPAAQEADLFLIPLLSGDHALGQVVEVEKAPDNSVLCLLTLQKVSRDHSPTPIALSDMVSLVLLRPDHFEDGTWSIIGFETLPQIEEVFALEAAKANSFADIQIHDPAIIEAFVNACHGLYPWDAFPDPEFFNALLIKPSARPDAAKMASEFPQ